MPQEAPIPRYSERQFPPYTYVPGQQLHPVSDPGGHMYGTTPHVCTPVEIDAWQQSETYLYGIDLFNYGYYWEAHESWEALWHATGRKGSKGDFFKGLIKLAAAGVKVCEGNPAGVIRHALRAKELFQSLNHANAAAQVICGIRVAHLLQTADAFLEQTKQPNTISLASISPIDIQLEAP